ncbi:hypothetical protein ACHWQZ_G002390 [Mnemiopsis leidyi]
MDLHPCIKSSIGTYPKPSTEYLEDLKKLTPEQLKGWKFCTADVTSLYTNIDIQGCVHDVMELAAEHQQSLRLNGLELIDIHEMLEYVFDNAYFTFNNRRYVDDAGTLATSRHHALQIFSSIADQDVDGRLAWKIDYPDSEHNTVLPFLGTEIRVDEEGHLHHRFYRKEQKKQITLHYRSYHPFRTKVEVVKNFYRTAERSSTPDYVEESMQIVDHLLRCNGCKKIPVSTSLFVTR